LTRRLSREDQYLSEGLWHVQERNRAAGGGDVVRSWRENLILEHFFSPVLDISRLLTGTDNRWPTEQRADVEARAAADTDRLVSEAAPFPIYTWRPVAFWAGVLALMAASVLACFALEGRP
jgi:hypothetical protein